MYFWYKIKLYFIYAIPDDMTRFLRSKLNQPIEFTISSFVYGENDLAFILKYTISLGGWASLHADPAQGAYDAPPDPLVACYLDLISALRKWVIHLFVQRVAELTSLTLAS
jgi:hypothetical protein